MEDKNKHNIFSKEEFFKHIDEKRSLPPDADEFDKEAMEGLSLVKDRTKLEKVDAAIDEVVRREKVKAGRKKNMYYFAAAASLALIIGIFFLVKETTLKKDANLAQSAPEKTQDAVKGFDFPPPPDAQKDQSESEDKKIVAEEMQASKGKEASFKEGKPQEKPAKSEDISNGIATVNVPAESENRAAANEKSSSLGWSTGAAASGKMQDNKGGGKSTLDETTTDQEVFRGAKDEPSQKAEEKKIAHKKGDVFSKNLEDSKLYKEADEKEKKHYESNTVWTTTPSPNGPGALKQQSQAELKPKATVDDRSVAGTTATSNAAPVATQTESGDLSKADKNNNNGDVTSTGEEQLKLSEVSSSKKSGTGGKRRKLKSNAANQPAPTREGDKDVAGYAYYSQTSTRDFTSPEFIGGTPALQQFISDNLEVSQPEKKGTVGVEFTVRPDGAVDTSNIKITQPISGCDPCSKDVKDLVKKMPRWQPAMENGKGKEYRQKVSVPYKSRQAKK